MFGKELVYNPWSIINYLYEKELKPYWVNTSDNALIKEMISKDRKRKIIEGLGKLVLDEEFFKHISENIIFSNLYKSDNFWSLMFFSGYLTYSGQEINPSTGRLEYSLRIPNNEIRSFFKDTFIDLTSPEETDTYSDMMSNLLSGNMEDFIEEFKEAYFNAISYHDGTPSEAYYHYFMFGFLLTQRDNYIVLSNREGGKGRYDITLEPRNREKYGFVFEFKKVAEGETLEAKSNEALQQINDNKYYAPFLERGVNKFIKIGMAFDGKDVSIKYEIIEN